jgi:hypothetical protein
MDIRQFNREHDARRWEALGASLDEIRREQGLGAAIETLVAQQRDAGVVDDAGHAVERRQVYHPHDRSRFFLVQYNPARRLRGAGAGRPSPPPGVASLHEGCFLCRENVGWRSRGLQIGFALDLDDAPYLCLCNPFPLADLHLTVAAGEHRPQGWLEQGIDLAPPVDTVIRHLARLAERLPGYVAFFNGVDAGASIPHHFHFQAFRRADATPFPLEAARTVVVADPAGEFDLIEYPIAAIHLTGDPDGLACRGAALMRRIARLFEPTSALSANLIASRHPAATDLDFYVVPRHRKYHHASGFGGQVAGLEILGELVLSTDVDKENLDRGRLDYHALAAILAGVEPQCLRRGLRTAGALAPESGPSEGGPAAPPRRADAASRTVH